MAIRYQLVSDLLHHLSQSLDLRVGRCEADLSAKIEKLPLPITLKRVFQWSWVNRSSSVGRYYLNSTEEVFSQECFTRLLSVNMLVIGSAKNGDELVVRFAEDDCEVGLLNCIDLAGEEDADPRSFYVQICGSLDELLLRIVEKRFLPIDFYSASEFAQLTLEMSKSHGLDVHPAS